MTLGLAQKERKLWGYAVITMLVFNEVENFFSFTSIGTVSSFEEI